MTLNALDIFAFAVLAVSTVTALIRGFVAELISLCAVILGVFAAILYYDKGTAVLGELGLAPPAAQFVGFLGIFLAALGIGALTIRVVRKILKTLHLRLIDRLLGGLFGLVRGGLINVALFLAMATFQIGNSLLTDSRLAEFFLTSAGLLVALTPQDFREKFGKGSESIYRTWIEQTRRKDGEATE